MAQIIEKRIQWNSLKTFKFTVNFKAFQPEVSNTKVILLRQLSQKTMLVSYKLKHSLIFSGTGINSVNLKIQWGVSGVPFTNAAAQIGEFDLQLPVTPTTGLFKTMEQFKTAANPNADPLIFNHDFATDIFLKLTLNNSGDIDNLTQGDFEIWLTTIRNV